MRSISYVLALLAVGQAVFYIIVSSITRNATGIVFTDRSFMMLAAFTVLAVISLLVAILSEQSDHHRQVEVHHRKVAYHQVQLEENLRAQVEIQRKMLRLLEQGNQPDSNS